MYGLALKSSKIDFKPTKHLQCSPTLDIVSYIVSYIALQYTCFWLCHALKVFDMHSCISLYGFKFCAHVAGQFGICLWSKKIHLGRITP